MTIADRIFDILEKENISQKVFSERTGIAQSTISDWKKKGTNPTSDKILPICDVLNVSPVFLLSGIENKENQSTTKDYIVVCKESEEGKLVERFLNLNKASRMRVIGYVDAINDNK